ncbi:MAG: DNA repair protein RecO [Lachnospiraceae bacterium]|nr:DNA repair protein RecO [Lachnospiraceae bacterium]
MADSVNVSGIVLSVMPIGEYDKRLVLLTREFGKITAFARGARRPGSSLLAAANPFVFGTFTLIPGKSAYNLIQTDIKNYFVDLAKEQPGVYYGFYFLELADYYGRENLDATEMLNLLYISLRALLNPSLDNRLVRRIYELRLMTINGEYSPEQEDFSAQALYVVQYIMYSPMEKLFTFSVTPEVLAELEKKIERYRRRTLDRTMRSLQILEMFL